MIQYHQDQYVLRKKCIAFDYDPQNPQYLFKTQCLFIYVELFPLHVHFICFGHLPTHDKENGKCNKGLTFLPNSFFIFHRHPSVILISIFNLTYSHFSSRSTTCPSFSGAVSNCSWRERTSRSCSTWWTAPCWYPRERPYLR